MESAFLLLVYEFLCEKYYINFSDKIRWKLFYIIASEAIYWRGFSGVINSEEVVENWNISRNKNEELHEQKSGNMQIMLLSRKTLFIHSRTFKVGKYDGWKYMAAKSSIQRGISIMQQQKSQ
jgi:hypothetical protein